ncbi:MAG TPA: hypothetical protein VJB59_10330 [Bdellovibrionota bacterium]|nr:hypothetical protein [Bdellovibrionota bacterium]
MSADQASNPVDLKKLRHDLSGAVATLETAIRNIKQNAPASNEAFELHEMALERLREILKTLDWPNP